MLFSEFWERLSAAQQAIRENSLERQDEALNALFWFCERRKEQYYPSLLAEHASYLLGYYLDRVLPDLGFTPADRRAIATDYQTLLASLNASAAHAQQFETALTQTLDQIRQETDRQPEQLVEAMRTLAQRFCGIETAGETAARKLFQDYLPRLRENFRYAPIAEFFRRLLAIFLGDAADPAMAQRQPARLNFKNLCEYVLDAYFQANAVLVDNFRRGQILPFWVAVDRARSSARVEFWNPQIDEAMQASADTARRIARRYLKNTYGRRVPKNMAVQCLFPMPEVNFKDVSASLLIGLRIVGEVLGAKSPPATVVTGEVARSGDILGVGLIKEKLAALNHAPGVARFLLPDAQLYELKTVLPDQQALLLPVRTFAEAVRQALDLHQEDWGEALEVNTFYGRQQELAELQQGILTNRCRLAAILGMGAIGKTTLAKKLADQVKADFQAVFWRDLRNAPPARELLGECLKFLSAQQRVALPEETAQRIALLLNYLKQQRCLLVLDNLETVLQGGEGGQTGFFRRGYEHYGELIAQIGAKEHQSCLLITSREMPYEIALLEGRNVRALALKGLPPNEAEAFLTDLHGTPAARVKLAERYAGHPLALKLVAASIQDLFQGDLTRFLETETALFINIEILLKQQADRLTRQEREVLDWLAIEREAVSFAELQKDLVTPAARKQLPNTLAALQQKSLVEKTADGFTLQPVVLEYFTERLIHAVCAELCARTSVVFNRQALLKAETKEYVRASQMRLIVKPLLETLRDDYRLDQRGIEAMLKELLAALRANDARRPGYAGGNILNLLVALKSDLTGWDFSQLMLWQAYLQGATLPQVNFAGADLSRSVFTETFGSVLSVAISPDGELLAAGAISNEIRIWSIKDGRPRLKCAGHADWVWSVAFSPDGKTLASGSQDQTVRLWSVATGDCLQTLAGHAGQVWSVTFSPAGNLLASGGDDQTVKFWDVPTGRLLHTVKEHAGAVHTVAFSPDGRMFASGSADYTMRLWQVPANDVLNPTTVLALRPRTILTGHANRVRAVAFSPDQQLLASGSDDHAVKIWELSTGQCVRSLDGHGNFVKSVAFSPDGATLASSSDDWTIRLWDVPTGRPLRVLQEHAAWVWSVVFSPDGQRLASGSSDHSVRLWEVGSGQCVKTLHGYTNRVLAAAFHPDNGILASGFSDQTIRVWDVRTKQCLTVLSGHANWVNAVAFDATGELLASGSSDQTIRLWEFPAGRCLGVLQGHRKQVRAVAFSPDSRLLLSCSDDLTVRLWTVATRQPAQIFEGHTGWVLTAAFHPQRPMIASGSEDHSIRLWDFRTGACLKILNGHTDRIRSIAFSPDGQLLASGGGDQVLRVWEVETGTCRKILTGHRHQVRSVAFSPDGRLLASGSQDQTIRLWDRATGNCLHTLQGHHENWIWAVTFSPDGRLLASASEDGTISLWNPLTGAYLDTLRPARPYEGLNITGVTGLSAAQKATLIALGAVTEE